MPAAADTKRIDWSLRGLSSALQGRRGMPPISILKRERIRQIRFCSRFLRRLTQIPVFFAFIKIARELAVLRVVVRALTGYHRPFPTLRDAAVALSGYEGYGHTDPEHAKFLMALVDKARPSDYAALFHIQSILSEASTVFDFGGNVGNLFYCYAKYLKLPAKLSWIVYDLPGNLELGRELARKHDVGRLTFTNQLTDAEGVDLFIATGSLHYFERSLAEIIADFRTKPNYILINRTPLTDGPAFATIQDGGTHRVACMVYSRAELIRGFEALGYETVDSWSALERSLIVPCYPERSLPAYSGMFFRLLNVDKVGT